MPYIIKRYANRKMYDQQTSRYVTLDEIKQLIRVGGEVRVEDAESGEDLTSLTLTQILLETERTHQPAVPSALLHQLIKHGDAWYDFLDRALRTTSLDQISGTPRDIARFWTDWSTRAGWPVAATPAPARDSATTSKATPTKTGPVNVAGPMNVGPVTQTGSLEDELSALKEKLLSLEQRLDGKKGKTGIRRQSRPSRRQR